MVESIALPPAVLTDDPEVAASAARRLQALGWRRREGWEALPATPWDLRGHRLMAVGTVVGPEDASDAVLAAVRGAAVVIVVAADAGTVDRLVADLRRVAHVEPPAPEVTRDGLDDEQRRLLSLLEGGATMQEAAGVLHLSVRTAERRLAAARRALGARTTAEAIRLAAAARRTTP